MQTIHRDDGTTHVIRTRLRKQDGAYHARIRVREYDGPWWGAWQPYGYGHVTNGGALQAARAFVLSYGKQV